MASLASIEPLTYPYARRDESVYDDYHGVRISDPYRWLEDPDSDEVKDFVDRQAILTDSILNTCDARGKLLEKITSLFDYPRFAHPYEHGNKFYYFYNTGLQAQDVLYVQESLDGERSVLLDPNKLSEDGTVSLATHAVSEDGRYLAYGVSSSGSDWVTIKLMEIESREIQPDTLRWAKFTDINWTHDNKGFFYCRYPIPDGLDELDAGTETGTNLNQKIYYHFVGSDQSDDILCWEDPDNPKHMFDVGLTEDGKYLLLYILESCAIMNKLYYCDADAIEGLKEGVRLLPFNRLIDRFDASYSVIANDGPRFILLTNKDAPKYKLTRVDIANHDSWTDVLRESETDVLHSACPVNKDRLIVCYTRDVRHVLQIRDLHTGSLLHELPLDVGTVTDVSAKRKHTSAFIEFTGFLTPGTIYRCDLARSHDDPEMEIFMETTIHGFDRSDFEAKQVFVESNNVRVPMFVVGRKGMELDGSHPCLLYGYGGFNISIMPSFSVARLVLMRHLGVLVCVANVRGGGEYGERWHASGSLANKQNCFDDFVAAAEYLVSTRHTRAEKLCIEGGSNGGLLVGACVNQKPELFGCALAHVGVMDMLRFHKFTIGHAWISDYGCSDVEEQFQWLIKYSPLHNVRRPSDGRQYPAIMLLTADHDDRVVPLHSLKFLATLQHVLCTDTSPQTKPILGRIERKAGHGAGIPTQKKIAEAADRYAFMSRMVGAVWID